MCIGVWLLRGWSYDNIRFRWRDFVWELVFHIDILINWNYSSRSGMKYDEIIRNIHGINSSWNGIRRRRFRNGIE